jgi:hypothetical protein
MSIPINKSICSSGCTVGLQRTFLVIIIIIIILREFGGWKIIAVSLYPSHLYK